MILCSASISFYLNRKDFQLKCVSVHITWIQQTDRVLKKTCMQLWIFNNLVAWYAALFGCNCNRATFSHTELTHTHIDVYIHRCWRLFQTASFNLHAFFSSHIPHQQHARQTCIHYTTYRRLYQQHIFCCLHCKFIYFIPVTRWWWWRWCAACLFYHFISKFNFFFHIYKLFINSPYLQFNKYVCSRYIAVSSRLPFRTPYVGCTIVNIISNLKLEPWIITSMIGNMKRCTHTKIAIK